MDHDEPTASELFPIVTTRDLRTALGFYRDLLGGRVNFEFPGPDGCAAARHGVRRRRDRA